MRIAWLLIAILAAPIAAAQTEAKPTLTLDPAVMDVAPGAQSTTHALLSNPLAREIVLNLSVLPSDGVKARLDKPQVRIPAGGSASVLVTTLVPNATNVTHTVKVGAKETNASRATAASAPAILLAATLELRVGVRPPPAAPPPNVVVEVRPAQLDLPSGGNATLTVVVHNGGKDPIPARLELRLPATLRATPQPPGDRIGPGATMEIPVLLEDAGALDVGADVPAFVGVVGFLPRGEPFTLHVVAAPAPAGAEPALPSSYVVGAAIVAGAAGAWTAAWLTRRHWWPLLALLYTRLRPSKILDHPVRRRIAEIVQAQPGISFSDLARAAGIAPGQLTHHARMLEKAGVVFSSPDGQTRRFFHVGAGRLASVAPLSQRALDSLRERPRSMSQLAKDLGVSRQALHYHVKQLVADGKLVAKMEGRDMHLDVAGQPSSARSDLARA